MLDNNLDSYLILAQIITFSPSLTRNHEKFESRAILSFRFEFLGPFLVHFHVLLMDLRKITS